MPLIPPFALATALLLALLSGFVPASRRWAGPALAALGLGLLASGVALGLTWAPPDRYMGSVQRIMYVHVPLVWSAMLAALVTFAGSLAFLWSGAPRAVAVAEAAAEVGAVLGGLGLVLGAVWGRPTWGVWWTWDPRLTATFVMLVLLAAVVVTRRLVPNLDTANVLAAGLGGTQAVALPLVALSVRLWNTLHQLPSTAATMHPAMTLTLRWNAVAFLCLFVVLVHRRVALSRR